MYQNNAIYQADLAAIAALDIPWQELQDKSLLISGASGLIGTFLVDLLLYRNQQYGNNCTIYALGRNEDTFCKRFTANPQLYFIKHDISTPLCIDAKVDFLIHAASNTHPIAYSSDPIGTITTNIFGTYSMLNYAAAHPGVKTLLLSTVEVYGENRGDVEAFTEDYCGHIDCNTLRAGYPEGKRTAEALCQSFIAKHGVWVNIARLSRVYGPTMSESDSKAIAQFIRNALRGEDIVIKGDGKPYFSYCYMADAVSGLLTVMLSGKNGEAYNVSDKNSNVTIRQLTETIAAIAQRQVRFDIPSSTEKQGFSKVTKAIMATDKLEKLGWSAITNMEQGLRKTISILKENC